MSRIVNEKGEPFVDDAIEGIEAEPKCDDKPITITWEIRRGQIKHQLYNACLHHFLPMQMLKELFDALNEVVPVVRCKDCKWYTPYRSINGKEMDEGECEGYNPCVPANHFCSKGERKDEVEE